MKVDRDKALTSESGGQRYYFCSKHCLHAFEAGPETNLGGRAAVDRAHTGHPHH
jgi:YHS domain-containing protein